MQPEDPDRRLVFHPITPRVSSAREAGDSDAVRRPSGLMTRIARVGTRSAVGHGRYDDSGVVGELALGRGREQGFHCQSRGVRLIQYQAGVYLRVPVRLPKRVLAARIRADLAEKRITRKALAALTERSVKTVERWTSDAAELEKYRPTRAEVVLIAHLTEKLVSRYTGDEADDGIFRITPGDEAQVTGPDAR